MAGLAVCHARYRVRAPACERIRAALAAGRDQLRLAAIGAPGIGGVEPLAVSPAFEIARLDPLAVEGEFFPEARADREDPGFRIRPVDGGARRQGDPAALGGAIAPQRVLRREREVRGIDLQG